MYLDLEIMAYKIHAVCRDNHIGYGGLMSMVSLSVCVVLCFYFH